MPPRLPARAPDDQTLSISALHDAYARGLTPDAVLALIHDRLARLDDPGIFLHLAPPAARTLPAFDPARFPLWGIPVAVKDNIDVAGMPTTAACPAFARTPDASAAAVERLEAAGALILGKTNLDQFATGLVGVRTPYLVPRNACAPDRVPGGSSSGSAVAVAQGLASLALGTDTAGSGRIPAALNGIVGLKPSVGAIPTRGVVPACPSLDCVSVFATGVADAMTAFDVMAGPDPADPWSRPLAAQTTPIRRLGVPRAEDLFLDEAPMRPAWSTTHAAAATLLPTEPVDLTPFLTAARMLYEGAFVAERDAAFGDVWRADPDAVHPVIARILATAAPFTATDAFRALHRMAALKAETRPVWAEVDALLVPSAPNFPTVADLAADPITPNARIGTYTNFVNLMDLTALAIPGPRRADGLPFGITLIGPRGSESGLADLATRLQEALQ